MTRGTSEAVDDAVDLVASHLARMREEVASGVLSRADAVALATEALRIAEALAGIESTQRASTVAEGHLLLAALVGKKSIDSLPVAQRAHVLRQLTGMDPPEVIPVPGGEASDE